MYITFENSDYLWLLFTIPLYILLHFYFLRHSKSKALKFANFEALKRVSDEKIFTKNLTHLFLRVLTILLLIIAVSGAALWVQGSVNEFNYVIALDASPSMTAQDVPPSRFEAAKEYISVFVDSFDSRTEFGLVTFAGIVTVEQILTDSRSTFNSALSSAEIHRAGGTDLAGAIITSTNLLIGDPDKGRAIIVVSDGGRSIETFITDPLGEASRYARNNQVVIHAIGLGTDSGPIGYLPEYYDLPATYFGENLERLAEETGGIYLYAPSSAELEETFIELAGEVTVSYIDYNIAFLSLIGAIILLFIEWGLANSIYRRVL